MNKIGLYILVLMLFASCISESVISETPEYNDDASYLAVTSVELQRVSTYAGEMNDFAIDNFRIIAFDGTGQVVSNEVYNAGLNDIIKHPIDIGTYDFLFLANEPDDAGIRATLNGLTVYGELDDIAFPASSFRSDTLIPMMQEIKNIEVLKGGAAKMNGSPAASPIQLELIRMGTRLDITLNAVENINAIFTGITLSNIPDRVPLTANYTGTINRNQTRTYLKSSAHYSDTTIAGIKWTKNISRIILPSNEFTPKTDKNNATVFTIDMDGPYDPSCELKIEDDNYTLPQNSKLKLIATANMPLILNIEASPWTMVNTDWNTNYRILNVSQLDASITDYNGVRISFWSNMPKVRVLPEVYVGASGTTTEPTNKIFNDLAITDGTNSTTRFSYDPATGSGYMDILVDTVNAIGNYTYRLILSAEEADGTNQLQREIKVNVTQLGIRPGFGSWEERYVGTFHRNDETGERVISGEHMNGYSWTATVENGADFITLSSTPCFDPDIGTNNPGDPELFTVTPNSYRGEFGGMVEGKGRIYFRVGLKSKNTTGKPRYGIINVNYQHTLDWRPDIKIYVRQGEDADYVWRPEDLITEEVLSGLARDSARMFSPYNLTAQKLKDDNSTVFHQLDAKGGVFVDYPSQGGAHFQWGIDQNAADFGSYVRCAYHPTAMINMADWSLSNFSSPPTWNPPSGYAYSTDAEVCPDGYHRPSDGFTDQIAFNGPYDQTTAGSPYPDDDYSDQIEHSVLRVSLLQVPREGNAYEAGSVTSTYPTTEQLPNTFLGYYADGFFDRRPIDMTYMTDGALRAVSTNNARIAFAGVLYYNPNTHASLFLPSAGRRVNTTSELQYRGSAGYYWSSSTAPWYPDAQYGVWGFESTFWGIQTVSSLGGFGHSIRCVKD